MQPVDARQRIRISELALRVVTRHPLVYSRVLSCTFPASLASFSLLSRRCLH